MSKADILQSISAHKAAFPAAPEIPSEELPAISPEQQLDLFKKSLTTAGAEIVELSEKEIDDYTAANLPGALDFTNPEIKEEYAVAALDKLNKIERALFAGRFGVAENGAVWLEDNNLPQRIIPFITQHLILKLDAKNLCANMQEAYKQIHLNGLGFGVFISGPSKTADIEQSLVYGAHGAKELTVIIAGK
ncbi:MAG: LUD domain-containing protein [Prevotellaceae bacterium]|jgi:L-lactate dehydrogenase complex protein LldG|nr:LUD domain-containing protein [Prevotellaceae bacterium]